MIIKSEIDFQLIKIINIKIIFKNYKIIYYFKFYYNLNYIKKKLNLKIL